MNPTSASPPNEQVFYHYIYNESTQKTDKYYVIVDHSKKEVKLEEIKTEKSGENNG